MRFTLFEAGGVGILPELTPVDVGKTAEKKFLVWTFDESCDICCVARRCDT